MGPAKALEMERERESESVRRKKEGGRRQDRARIEGDGEMFECGPRQRARCRVSVTS